MNHSANCFICVWSNDLMKANGHVVELPKRINELNSDGNVVVSSLGLPKISAEDRVGRASCQASDLRSQKKE